MAGIAAVAGCGAGSDEPPSEATLFQRWDSADVRITQSPGDVLQRPLPWVIDTVPDLEIGSREGEAPYQFTSVSQVVALPGGEIVVADQRSLGLRWFDADGAFVRSVGRRGPGPGEFMRSELIRQFQPDSLLVIDDILLRLTSFGTDGQDVRMHSAAELGQLVYSGRAMAAYAGRIAFLSGMGACSPEDGVCEALAPIVTVDPRGAPADTLAFATRRLFQISVSGRTTIMAIPFEPVVSAATDDRSLLLSLGEEFEIRRFGPDGRFEEIMRIDDRPALLEAEELDSVIRPESVIRGWLSQMEIRERMPAFQALRVDALGWIWAELWRSGESEPDMWAILDPSGQARGTVTALRDFVLHDIGADFVLGVSTDAMGVPYVRRYPLRRSDAGGH